MTAGGGRGSNPASKAAIRDGHARGLAKIMERRRAGLAYAAAWRRRWGPVFDRMYGPNPQAAEAMCEGDPRLWASRAGVET